MRQSFFIPLVAALSIAAAGSAHAASREQAQERAARKACLTGDYTTGVAILADLFLDSKDPIWLFNQGRCLEQNRRYEDAIARFEEYLRAGETTKLYKSDRAAAQKHIEDCKESLAQQAARTPPVAASQPVAEPQEAPVLPPPAPQPPPVVVSQPNPIPTSHSGLRTAEIATVSVGGAAMIAGLLLNLKVNSMASDMEKPAGYSGGKESDRKTYETLGWVGYGAGAACIATGAVLYLLGRADSEPRTGSVAMLPLLSSDRAGVALQGGF